MMSDEETDDDDNDDESTIYQSKPHLDPQAVIILAKSIPNCSRVTPPRKDNDRLTTASSSSNNAANANNNNNTNAYTKSESSSSYFESSSYFSSFSRRLQQTFSAEENQKEEDDKQRLKKTDILSFLVSDAYSIEQLAAEAEGKHTSTSELEGAGIARIDVYCVSGTVCTCRVIQTATAGADPSSEEEGKDNKDANDDGDDDVPPEATCAPLDMLPTPRKGNVSQRKRISKDTTNNAATTDQGAGTQVRRIIRRKCTIEALRRILEQPPKLPEINQSIIAFSPFNDHDHDHSNTDSDASHTSLMSVSKILLKRQQKRHLKKHKKFSKLSTEQQAFLKVQQKKYEKRIRRDEKVRQHVGNAILAAGMGGCGSEMGVDLMAMRSMSLEEMTVASGQTRSPTRGGSTKEPNVNAANVATSPTSTAYNAQKVLREKIEIADMGLAILMGEAQRLERIMVAMKEKDTDTDTTRSCGSKHSRTTGGGDDDTAGSFSTWENTDREDTMGDDDDTAPKTMSGGSHSSNSSVDSSSEERKMARKMQGCEIEYSFPHDYHDELEGALMGDDVVENSSSSDDDSDAASEPSKVARRQHSGNNNNNFSRISSRGRSPGAAGKKHAVSVSPIVAVPTNGVGCVVLRENHTFDVIGKIPEVLRKKLFRKNGPLPDQIALGTLGRYYVHFVDGSFFFYGPPSLSKILIKGNKKQTRRGKDRNRGKRGGDDTVSVVSVAFGKHLDDFFVVRYVVRGTLFYCFYAHSDSCFFSSIICDLYIIIIFFTRTDRMVHGKPTVPYPPASRV